MRALRLHGSATFFFFFNDTATTEIYTLSLHDALPICALPDEVVQLVHEQDHVRVGRQLAHQAPDPLLVLPAERRAGEQRHMVERDDASVLRSEEHTSELQSPCNLVCRLLLEKKKNTDYIERRVSRDVTRTTPS